MAHKDSCEGKMFPGNSWNKLPQLLLLICLLVLVVMFCNLDQKSMIQTLSITHHKTPGNIFYKKPIYISDTETDPTIILNDNYEADLTNCSVTLNRSGHFKNPDKMAICTWEDFHKNALQQNGFVSKGRWISGKLHNDKLKFYPDFCNFGVKTDDPFLFSQCMKKNKFQKILLTGDSNSRMLTINLIEALNMLEGISCQEVTRVDENGHFWVPQVPARRLQCNDSFGGFGTPGCSSYIYSCALLNNVTISIEFIPMLHFLDSTLRVQYGNSGEFDLRMLNAETKLEYILKYYLPYHGFPDLWIVSPPFHHESWGSTYKKTHLDLLYVMDLLDIYLPNSTQMVFLSDGRECPAERPIVVKREFNKYWHQIRNEKLHYMNQILFSVLKKYIRSSVPTNYHMFLDCGVVSCPLVCGWHKDGAHFVPVWYQMMSKYILELFCSD